MAGPISVPPGERVELLSGVAAPPEAGYVTSARATLVDADGQQVHHHAVHLHHAVWLNPHQDDLTCDTYEDTAPNFERFFATGSERTEVVVPDGYGYHWVSPAPQARTDVPDWVLVAMLDGMAGHAEAFIQLDLGYVAEVDADGIVPVRPVWLDVRNCSAHPVFTVEAGSGEGGLHEEVWTYEMPIGGRFVFAGGHLHDGGLQLRLDNATAGTQLFTSEAIHSVPGQPWPLTAMTTFADPDGVPVASGDVLRLTAVYDSSRTWQDVMGIMVAMLAPPRPEGVDPHPGQLPAAPDQPARDDDAAQPPTTASEPTASAGRPVVAVSAGAGGAVGLAVFVLTLRRRDRRR